MDSQDDVLKTLERIEEKLDQILDRLGGWPGQGDTRVLEHTVEHIGVNVDPVERPVCGARGGPPAFPR
jgi:hypothetical protein